LSIGSRGHGRRGQVASSRPAEIGLWRRRTKLKEPAALSTRSRCSSRSVDSRIGMEGKKKIKEDGLQK
jgi:hypothetical protein